MAAKTGAGAGTRRAGERNRAQTPGARPGALCFSVASVSKAGLVRRVPRASNCNARKESTALTSYCMQAEDRCGPWAAIHCN
jgi:hypothetical protein